uniref:Uncharacterized protein n=1 Tax=Macrostomum lignano TaxID=282301 RepID=A0A1I8JNC6_9PLAT
DYLWPNQRDWSTSSEFYFQLPPGRGVSPTIEPVEGTTNPAYSAAISTSAAPSLNHLRYRRRSRRTPPRRRAAAAAAAAPPPPQQQPGRRRRKHCPIQAERVPLPAAPFNLPNLTRTMAYNYAQSRGNRLTVSHRGFEFTKSSSFVLLITQGALNGAINFPAGLAGILAFCDQLGRRCSGQSGFFKALDTETMALLWQRIKGNRTGQNTRPLPGPCGCDAATLPQEDISLPRTPAGAKRSGFTSWAGSP